MVQTQPFSDALFDTVIVVGGDEIMPITAGLADYLRRIVKYVRRIGSTCTGTFPAPGNKGPERTPRGSTLVSGRRIPCPLSRRHARREQNLCRRRTGLDIGRHDNWYDPGPRDGRKGYRRRRSPIRVEELDCPSMARCEPTGVPDARPDGVDRAHPEGNRVCAKKSAQGSLY
jgi:hypothetical protein